MEFGKTWIPDLNRPGMRPEEKITAIGEYLISLDKQIRHTLSNLDEENLSDTFRTGISTTNARTENVEKVLGEKTGEIDKDMKLLAEGIKNAVTSIEELNMTIAALNKSIETVSGKATALETTCADLQMKTFSCGAAKKLTLKFTQAPYGGCAVFIRSSARSALMLVALSGTSATPTTASNENSITLPTVAFTSSTNTLTITAATGVHMGVMLYGQVNDTLASATVSDAT